jgi:hypothetical protein
MTRSTIVESGVRGIRCPARSGPGSPAAPEGSEVAAIDNQRPPVQFDRFTIAAMD